MVDTITCQTKADLTEPFYKKLLLGAKDNTLDHKEPIVSPSSYNNYAHHPTAGGDRKQQDNGNSTGRNWDTDRRQAESSHHVGEQFHTAPKTAIFTHPYDNTPNPPHQPPRFFDETNLGQASEQQQPFRESPPPVAEKFFCLARPKISRIRLSLSCRDTL